MKMKLKQYQEYARIDSGSTDLEISANIFKIMGLNPDEYKDKDVMKEIQNILKPLLLSQNKYKYVKLKNRWYKVDRDLHELRLGQWITFDNIMKSVDKDNISDYFHYIISCFLRPCRFWKLFPKSFNSDKIKEISELVLDMEISIAMELTNFFFLYTQNYMRNMNIEYLEKLDNLEAKLIQGQKN